MTGTEQAFRPKPGKLWREFYDYAIAHGATMSQAIYAANEAIRTEVVPLGPSASRPKPNGRRHARWEPVITALVEGWRWA